MITILIGILNPIALVNKARDSRRKKDLGRIKIAFEEYYNDKGCYPNDVAEDYLVTNLMKKDNCGKSFIFGKWLKPWPCDPNGEAYQIYTGWDDNCPNWFKILTTLENRNDPSINIVGVAENDPNYAVSSGNISPGGYLGDTDPECIYIGSCFRISDQDNKCKQFDEGGCEGPNCYSRPGCEIKCRVSCCGSACSQ